MTVYNEKREALNRDGTVRTKAQKQDNIDRAAEKRRKAADRQKVAADSLDRRIAAAHQTLMQVPENKRETAYPELRRKLVDWETERQILRAKGI